ncbi:hypothetical protein ACWGII_33415 [Streptomyces sp. NPDC054855]
MPADATPTPPVVESRADGRAHDIGYGPGADRVYRRIRKDDYAGDWTPRAGKLFRVSDSPTGREPG